MCECVYARESVCVFSRAVFKGGGGGHSSLLVEVVCFVCTEWMVGRSSRATDQGPGCLVAG